MPSICCGTMDHNGHHRRAGESDSMFTLSPLINRSAPSLQTHTDGLSPPFLPPPPIGNGEGETVRGAGQQKERLPQPGTDLLAGPRSPFHGVEEEEENGDRFSASPGGSPNAEQLSDPGFFQQQLGIWGRGRLSF